MGIDQTVPIVDGTSVDSVITSGVTRAVLRAWTSPKYRTWFIAAVWPVERPRKNALLSALEGWAQADVDNEIGTGEEIVLAPRTGEVGQSSTARDDSEDVAPRRRRDT
ncbi:hypothetical protein JCGZ_09500 [Jatropha curcas]|uniref:Uncharacterized protein n=1 Tax=Jatropha curcas TaxID=180498 RepID=A0A067KK32_JATCU|nr:hypothetical protein JCGZ_09500 [Jatropha curcas]